MSRVKFIKDYHQYISEEGKQFISVSEFTRRFEPEVDWNAVARKVALKKRKEGENVTVEDILKKWKEKKDLSAKVGTSLHFMMENELLSQDNPTFYNIPCTVRKCHHEGGEKWSIPINKLENNSVYPELIIYDFDYMICGQSDKVIVANSRINIWDYKTNAEITDRAFSNRWVKPRKMLGPLSHLDHCDTNIFSIKMSIYMYLLWKANGGRLRTGDLIVEHIHLERDDDGMPVLRDEKPIIRKIEQIRLPYRRKEVIDMLETLKDGKWEQ